MTGTSNPPTVTMMFNHPTLSSRVKGGGKTNHEILADFANEALEREFANEKLSGLLVTSDFTKHNGSRAEAVATFKYRIS